MEKTMEKINKGFTLVEIMIVVAIIALLASIAIPNLQRARFEAQKANAHKTLSTFSAAAEMYQADNGEYPSNLTSLTGATPPYLNSDIADLCDDIVNNGIDYPSPTTLLLSTRGTTTVDGFRYQCAFNLTTAQYTFTACSELPRADGGKCYQWHNYVAPGYIAPGGPNEISALLTGAYQSNMF